MAFTVNEFKNNKWVGSWAPVATIEEAREIIAAMKITLANGSVFNIESQSGTVLEVVRA